MKPTTLRADTTFFENLNPSYHAYLKSYVKPELFKNLPKKVFQPPKPKEVNPEDINLTVMTDDDSKKNYLEHLYYNYHLLNFEFSGISKDYQRNLTIFLENELQNEPKPPYVWAHITCATFIPELYFSDDPYKSHIMGTSSTLINSIRY